MHGLVMVDKNLDPIGSSIIWCDSRATSIGKKVARDLGEEYCLEHLLNLPGNFTASKLRWVANRGDNQNGWDTDQFPNNLYEITEAMLVILRADGLQRGGINFDAKTRRNSTDLEDIFYAQGVWICLPVLCFRLKLW